VNQKAVDGQDEVTTYVLDLVSPPIIKAPVIMIQKKMEESARASFHERANAKTKPVTNADV
jgi:hypothetical protein